MIWLSWNKLKSTLMALSLPAILVGLWVLLSLVNFLPHYVLPSPRAVLAELVWLWHQGELLKHVAMTCYRVAAGFAIGSVAATLFGAMTGYSATLRQFLDPSLQALKAIPSLGWVPLFILWFGIFETSKILLIAVGVFFPVYLNLMSAIRDSDRKLLEVADVYHLSLLERLRYVVLPGALPAYFTGLRSGLALGWMFVIAAELMGASEGLGFLMLDGQMTGNAAVIIGSLFLFALLGKLSDAMITVIRMKCLHWQDTTVDAQT